jgi:very-short-patch-repair endonuclease
LIIEVDGASHFTASGIEHDQVRDAYLKNLGYRVLRIPGYALIREGREVVMQIREFVDRGA